MDESQYNRLRIGVLALQGAFEKHINVLQSLGVPSAEVRNPEDLERIDGLIIPGGESSTMLKLMQTELWTDQLRVFGQERPVFGTCAGMILMGAEVDDPRITPFGWLPIRVMRNAYGAQVNSFFDVGSVTHMGRTEKMEMIFIRAPKFEILSDKVHILGTCRNDPVIVQYGSHLATAFHPELTDDTRVHEHWLNHLLGPTTTKIKIVRPHESVG